uniref:Uncharacterized protein n=1 Tax=Nelumbo nucifera TaxID=4432 RepID=A0A822ZRZ3_NELNU|nr:TPA_asm: hypothetical protein HUJ06_018631 [Nelumbo nucifera]
MLFKGVWLSSSRLKLLWLTDYSYTKIFAKSNHRQKIIVIDEEIPCVGQ